MTRLRRALVAWRLPRAADGEEGVALLMSLGLIAVFSTLLLAMLALVVQQVRPTAQARKDVGVVNAAGSGLQAAVAMIRRSLDVNGEGTRGLLPCVAGASGTTTFRNGAATTSTPGVTLSGTTSTALPGSFGYSVSMAYFTQDPTDRPLSWLTANAMTCPLSATPLYAYLQSYGTGGPVPGVTRTGARAQVAVYQFKVPAANVAGGRLREFGQDLCLDAGSAPGVGTPLSFATCQPAWTAGSSLSAEQKQQLWQYRQDLTLFFGGNPALNLCVQGVQGGVTTLQRCTGAGDGATYVTSGPAYEPGQQAQEWSFNDNGHFAAAGNNGDVTGVCLQPQSTGVGASLGVSGCQGGTEDYQAFDPDAAVGAGKAGGNTTGAPGSPTSQYVNFAQFGRCLDVTGQNVNADHLIAYPCKQAPDSNRLTWNQVWTFPAGAGNQGVFTTTKGGTTYCLTAPGTGVRVTIRPCAGGQAEQWVAAGPTAGAVAYTLRSVSTGTCMSLDSSTASYGSSTVVLEACTGVARQRWNAPPPIPDAGLGNVAEGSAPR